MKPVKQDRLYSPEGIGNGNCMPACLASLLEIPLWMVPPFDQMFGRGDWGPRRSEWLARMFNLEIVYTEGHEVGAMPEFYIASGMSPREVMHACVYSGGKLIHDPHPLGGGIERIEYTNHLRAFAPGA